MLKKRLADLLKRRWIGTVCIWGGKGAKSCELNYGCKLLCDRTSNEWNGVGIAVSESFRGRIFLVERISDRLMTIKFHASSKIMHAIIAHAPPNRSIENEKNFLGGIRQLHMHNYEARKQ